MAWDNVNVSGSALNIASPSWTSSLTTFDNAVWRVSYTDLVAMGFPSNVPGVTYTTGNSFYTITRSTNYFSTRFTWYTDGTMSESLRRADVQTILAHEFGHTHGMLHPSDCGGTQTTAEDAAVMEPTWQAKKTLRADDKSGLSYLY